MTPMKQPATTILLGFGAAVFLGMASAWGQTYSHARVVRLSFVEGNVTLQRPDIPDWAEAPMNTPLQEGFKLLTGEGAFAEVELENGSTVRLGQLSLLEFTQLALAPDGSKIDRLTLQYGYATFHALLEGQDAYEVLTPNSSLTPRGSAMFRVDADSSEERVEVFHGSVEVAGSLGSWALDKNSVLDLGSGADQPVQFSQGITQDDWDRWVEERESAAEAANSSISPSAYSNSGSDNMYGWSDLSDYGNWSYVSGFGYGWVPNVGAGWSPYLFGRWCWYPGFGYVWISADPWGWLPYHFGGWEFIPGLGWVWFPGIFGPWSPALVVWYGGPGWIGWRPRHGLPGGGRIYPCPQGQACGTAVSTDTLRKGHRVGPSTLLDVKVASGRKMDQPDIQPERQAMLPGPVVAPSTKSTNTKVIIIGGRGDALTSHTVNPQPTTSAPGAAAGSSRVLTTSVVGSPARRAAPAPASRIIYDPAAGRYVNGSRLPSEGTEAQNELSTRSLPSVPGSPTSFAPRPAPRTPAGSASDPQSHGQDWSHHASPRSDSSSATAPRSGGTAPSSQSKSGNGSSGGHSSSGASGGGGGGTGGGGHGGGSSGGGSSGGGHH